MKYFHYISKGKVEMLLPQVRRARFSLKLSPKVDFAGVSIGGDIEKRDDPALVKQAIELVDRLERKGFVREVDSSAAIDGGTFFRSTATWRHGLFYFKGGVPTFWSSSNDERLLILTVIYVAWTTVGNTIVLLVGSPNNVLGEKVAPEGVFMPGTGGVEGAVRALVNSLRTDEPTAAIREEQGAEITLQDIKLGSHQRYTGEYGSELLPLPGFDDDWFALSLAQFCLDYLQGLPKVHLDTIFRVLSIHESRGGNFQSDLDQLADMKLERLSQWMKDGRGDLGRWRDEWRTIRESAERRELGTYSRVCFGSPLYTSLAGGTEGRATER